MSNRVDPLLVLGLLTRLLSSVPDKVRSRIYDAVSAVFFLATLVILVAPLAESLGVEVPSKWVALATIVVSLQARMASVHVTPAFALGGDAYLDPAERARYAASDPDELHDH